MNLSVENKTYHLDLEVTKDEIHEVIDEMDKIYMKFPPEVLPALNAFKNSLALMLVNN